MFLVCIFFFRPVKSNYVGLSSVMSSNIVVSRSYVGLCWVGLRRVLVCWVVFCRVG